MLIPFWFKFGGLAAVALLLFGGGWYVGNLRGDDRVDKCQTAAEASRAEQLRALATAWQNRELQFQAQEARRDAENQTLRDDALKYPIGPVRVCHITVAAGPAGTPLPAGQGQPAAPWVVQAEPQPVPRDKSVGSDFGPILSSVADDADSIVAACRATQPVAPKTK